MATLVYHSGALGDFLTTLPALRFWKARQGGERVLFLGKPGFFALTREARLFDEWRDLDDRRLLPLFHDRLSREAGCFLSRFTAAVLFTGEDSPLVKNIRASGIPEIHAQPPFPSYDGHVVDYHLSLFADPADLNAADRAPRIVVSNQAIRESYSLLPKACLFIAIHPGSGSSKKNWPFERFREIADMLRGKGIQIVWLAGPAEGEWLFPKEDIIMRDQPLPKIAALLSRCALYIGNDSGITHLAAASGCPVIALFGSSDPAVWAPRGERVRIVWKKTACAPCHRVKDEEKVCGRECMTGITVEEVMDVAVTAFNER